MASNDKNIVFRDDGTILLKDGRLSYPHLFEKYKMEEKDTPRYSCKVIFDKKTHAAAMKALGQKIVELEMQHFKAKSASDKRPLRDGDQLSKDELAGSWVISASETKHAPDVINKDKSRINESDDIIYAGCRVNVLVRPWAQNNKFGKRINFNLLAVQFVADDEPFSGIERPDTDEAFDTIDEDFDGADEPAGDDDDPFA